MTDEIRPGCNVAPPVCMSEAYSALKEAYKAIWRIKVVLAHNNLWSPPIHCEHEIPLNEGELFTAIANVMQDLNMIKQIIINEGMVENDDLIPLSPRWRIDGGEHHLRQQAVFEEKVAMVIEKVKNGEPLAEWKSDKPEVWPSK